MVCAQCGPATATANVAHGHVSGATVTYGGCGYTNTPLVLIQGGGGIGATATAAVSNGIVVGVSITAGGTGYNSTPTMLIGSAPSITSEPQSVTVNAGDNASFNVTAAGFPLTSYQWSMNGTNILGATNNSLTISNVVQTNWGTYAAGISNAFGTTNSNGAVLSIYPVVSLGLSGFRPTLTIQGATGHSYLIRRTADLSNSNSWVTVTNMTLAQPVQNWVDTSVDASAPFNPYYFYEGLPGATGGGGNIPTSGLTLFAKFSEGSGSTVADSSGNGHMGHLTNSPAWIPGETDDALNFVSAKKQAVNFGNLNLAGSNQCTFSMWMQKTNPADIGLAALGSTSGKYNAIFIAWWNDGYVYGGVGFTNAGRVFNAPYVANTWMHFVMVYDGTQLQNSNRINIFINGVQATPSPDQSWAKTAISTSIGTVSTNFSVSWDSNEGYESGRYDGVGVWNRVLTPAEIQQVYSNAAAGP